MTDTEKIIAETAICRRDMDTYDEIHHDVAHALDMKQEEVIQALNVLIKKNIVQKDAHKASYEKGLMWPKDTNTLPTV